MAAVIRLDELATALPAGSLREVLGDTSDTVSGMTHDSRDVRPGDLFACVAGGTTDGHLHAGAAVSAGATALLVERPLDLDVPQLVVENTRRVMGHAASAVHGYPSRSLTLVGITGTNGKTTTAHLLAGLLSGVGHRVEVVGTLTGIRTTPEAPDLQRRLAASRDDGVTTVVMEVSSHALALDRVVGTSFDVAVFTNLGRDHLDLHGSQEEYFRAKARLFTPELSATAVVNVDDPYGRLLADAIEIPVTTYSASDASDVIISLDSHRFRWRDVTVEVPLGGATNVMNSLAALTAAERLGIEPVRAAGALAQVEPVPGRFEQVAGGSDVTAIVDYAHTPEGLATLLESVRSAGPSGRVVLVFGCGGDRDRDKRPEMGRVAVDRADVVIVTSDNPRTEEPSAIAADIVAGMSHASRDTVTIELDRRRAIERAVDLAVPGDVVVVAGKGHEQVQSIGGVDHEFDDRIVASEALARRARS